ncbi:MAG TPA: tetratricopeptide repeat protein [Polyangiales bacterium]|nr:tetratricopeptide repeat protein [Polyangiales bacterium]
MKLSTGIVALCALLAGCAGSPQKDTTARQEVEFEELRINARAKEGGGYDFDSYDASDLFKRATDSLNAKKCEEAVSLYDKLTTEFPSSEYVSASLYNAGLCQQALGDFAGAADHYTRVRTLRPGGDDVKDASFLLAEVLVQLERFGDVLTLSDELLAREDLSAEERLEGMARRAQGLLGLNRLDDAEQYAQSALSYFRTRPKEQPIRDEFFAAACNYVLAETYRLREEGMEFPEGLEPQKQVLIKRAELVLQAQREYFNTISFQNLDNLHWAAASGYRIGHMYDELWQSIMSSPVPKNLKGEGEKPYHDELAKLIKPLIRHAIRYWELTLMFIERTGMKTTWSEKTKTDLARVRQLLLEQPEGPEGLPPAAATPTPAAPDPGAPPREPTRRGHKSDHK